MKATQLQIDQAISLIKQAATLEEIKEKTGLYSTLITLIQETHGLEKPWIIRKRQREAATLITKTEKVLVNTERDREIIELAQSGFTLRQISTKYGVSSERIRKILKQKSALSTREIRKQKNAQVEVFRSETGQILAAWVRSHMGCTMVELSLGTNIDKSKCSANLPKNVKHLVLKPGDLSSGNSWTGQKWTDNQILECIRKAGALSSPLSYKTYEIIIKRQGIDGPSAIRVLQRFKTWNSACETAGVIPGRSPRESYVRNWSDESMIFWLASFLRQADTASYDAYNKWSRNQAGAPGAQTIRNTLGPWSKCRELALLALRKEWTEN
jgi:hypothetical protein